MPDYILVPLVLLAIVAVEVAVLWFVLSKAARSMVSALGEYNEATADLRDAHRVSVTGGYLTFPSDSDAFAQAQAVARWQETR